jgi:hypothetical protein
MTESRVLELESEWGTQEMRREDSDRGTNADEDTTWEPNPLPLMAKHPPRVTVSNTKMQPDQEGFLSQTCPKGERIIRITPCVFDEMHTGALFRVFSKSCFFLRDSQHPATNLPPKCVWGSFAQLLMHTAALFKQQICQLAHGRRTQFHGVCI